MDMVCMPSSQISRIIAVYFIGFALGGLLFPLPDKYGRRFSLIFGLTTNLACQYGIVFSSNYWVRTACFGGIGLFQIKNSVSYVWLFECVYSKQKPLACTCINSFDALPMLVTCIYFAFISKHWFPLELVALLVGTAALIIVVFAMPESPRWLLLNGKTKEAIKNLNYIAWFNSSTQRIPENAQFVEDLNAQDIVVENLERSRI